MPFQKSFPALCMTMALGLNAWALTPTKRLPAKPLVNKAISPAAAKPVLTQQIASYTVLGDGSTVLANASKLIWMRCNLGQNWDGKGCTGQATSLTHRDALNEVKKINLTTGFVGAKDWRLPTLQELHSIVFCEQGFNTQTLTVVAENAQPQQYPTNCAGDDYLRPTTDPNIFPGTNDYWTWSATPHQTNVSNMWGINFSSGSVAAYNKHHSTAVRLVRNAP